MIRFNWLISGGTLFLAACQSGAGGNTFPNTNLEMIAVFATDPSVENPDRCWAEQTAPVPKAQTIRQSRPEDTPASRDVWFEVPCADDMTPNFATTLQRALKSRGLYDGVVDGVMGGGTRKAVHKYQVAHGLDSDVLSMGTARQLGVIAYPRPDSE